MLTLQYAKNNGYYDNVMENLKYRLSFENEKWCKPISHPSGRDFYDYQPVEMMSEDDVENLKEEVLDDVYTDYPDSDFLKIFDKVVDDPDVIDEMKKEGYYETNMEAFREFCDDFLFQFIFDGLVNENLGQ
jgi:hypothetical protein